MTWKNNSKTISVVNPICCGLDVHYRQHFENHILDPWLTTKDVFTI
jgi:hypothetical protein